MNKWTKEDIKKLAQLWDTDHTTQEIANKLRRSHSNVMVMVKKLRSAGLKLKRRYPGKYLDALIVDAVLEIKGSSSV